VRAKYPKFDNLLKLQAKHDPTKMFESRLFSRVVAGDTYKLTAGCALWQKCYCEADIHCSKGHKCVASVAFPQYKVCKPDIKNEQGSILPQLFAMMGDMK
jgi:hypothetical protein